MSPFFVFFLCGVCSLPSFVIPLMNDPVYQACTSPGRQGHTHHTLHTRLVCCVRFSCLDMAHLILCCFRYFSLSCVRLVSCLRLSRLVLSCYLLSCLGLSCLCLSVLVLPSNLSSTLIDFPSGSILVMVTLRQPLFLEKQYP